MTSRVDKYIYLLGVDWLSAENWQFWVGLKDVC